FFFLQQGQLVFEFWNDVWPHLFHRQQRLNQQKARTNVFRPRKAELDIAINYFSFPAQKIRANSVHRGATNGEELLKAQEVIWKILVTGNLKDCRRRLAFYLGLFNKQPEQVPREFWNCALWFGR